MILTHASNSSNPPNNRLIGPRAALFLGLALTAVLGAPPVQGSSPASFETGMAKVHSFLAKSRWKSAHDQIDKLLEAHREQPYVYVRKPEILETLKRCAFGAAHPLPHPKTLISGDLLSYKETSGAIKIRYRTSESLKDFEPLGSGEPARGSRKSLVHPLIFDGPYTIEIKAKQYPSTSNTSMIPVIFACIDVEGGFRTSLGFPAKSLGNRRQWLPARINRLKDGKWATVDEKETSTARPGKPYSFKVSVGKNEIATFCNKRKILYARKPASMWGKVGFGNLSDFSEIVISGKAQTSWIQGIVDASMQNLKASFEKTYDPEQELPLWLRTGIDSAETTPADVSTFRKTYPGKTTRGHELNLGLAERLLEEGKHEEGLELLEKLKKRNFPEAIRSYFATQFHLGNGDPETALLHCEKTLALDPEHQETRLIHTAILVALRRHDDAIREFETLIEQNPRNSRFHTELARLLLLSGRAEEAKNAIDRALSLSVTSPDLDAMNQILVKARSGPTWTRIHDYESRHYHVFSDLDKKTCIEAANLLEESYRGYTLHLQKVDDLTRRKFRVYLFSGEAGYQAYAHGTFGTLPIHTAGLYSLILKQLLIWNLPDRAAMMQTVRHEGFHQYLDRLMDSPPSWFNEGLAEYYELAGIEDGGWKEGQIESRRVKALQPGREKLIPLKDFLFQTPAKFYNKDHATLHYTQSWAFIHFLRHGSKEVQALFDSLFQDLLAGVPNKKALDNLVASVDPEKLHQEFIEYIDRIR